MRDLFWALGKMLFVFLLFVAFIATFVVLMTHLVSQPTCYAETADMDIEGRWSFWAGCQVEAEPGNWIPLKHYQYVKAEVRPAD